MLDPEKWYTPSEAAELIGVHVETIRRWVREGRVPAHLSQQRARAAQRTPEHKARTRGSPQVRASVIASRAAKARYYDSLAHGAVCPWSRLQPQQRSNGLR